MLWNTKTVIVLAFSLLVALNSSYSQWPAHGQMDGKNGTVSNNTELEFTTNMSVAPDTLIDDPHIMENTSGMIDEAFDALKDAFKSLIGK